LTWGVLLAGLFRSNTPGAVGAPRIPVGPTEIHSHEQPFLASSSLAAVGVNLNIHARIGAAWMQDHWPSLRCQTAPAVKNSFDARRSRVWFGRNRPPDGMSSGLAPCQKPRLRFGQSRLYERVPGMENGGRPVKTFAG